MYLLAATSEYTIEGINETIEDNAKREQELSDKLGESKRLLVELVSAASKHLCYCVECNCLLLCTREPLVMNYVRKKKKKLEN